MLDADINAILLGHSGRLDMFEAAGWIQREEQPVPAQEKVSAVAWLKATFG